MKHSAFVISAFVLCIGLAGCRESGVTTITLPDTFGTEPDKSLTAISEPVTAPELEDIGNFDFIAPENPSREDPNKATEDVTGDVASSIPTPPIELPSATPAPSAPAAGGTISETDDGTTWTISETAKEYAAPLPPPPLEMTPAPFYQAEWRPSEKENPYTITGMKTEIAMSLP